MKLHYSEYWVLLLNPNSWPALLKQQTERAPRCKLGCCPGATSAASTRARTCKFAGEKEPVGKGCQIVNGKRVTLLKDQLFNRDGSFIAGMNQRAVSARGRGTLCPRGRAAVGGRAAVSRRRDAAL